MQGHLRFVQLYFWFFQRLVCFRTFLESSLLGFVQIKYWLPWDELRQYFTNFLTEKELYFILTQFVGSQACLQGQVVVRLRHWWNLVIILQAWKTIFSYLDSFKTSFFSLKAFLWSLWGLQHRELQGTFVLRIQPIHADLNGKYHLTLQCFLGNFYDSHPKRNIFNNCE